MGLRRRRLRPVLVASASMKTSLVDHFGLAGPLVVAPMAGGPTTPALVAAASEAGALGSLGGAYLSPTALAAAIAETRARTSKPFAVNLFVPSPDPAFSPSVLAAALEAQRPFRRELGLPEPTLSPPFSENFEEQLAVLFRERPAALSFVFGRLPRPVLDECRRRGIITIGTATSPAEALLLEADGVDALVTQGVEAGGHRGLFSAEARDPGIGTYSLTGTVARQLRIPIIAAGGLMTGSDIARALRAGAAAAQLGTAFLTCDESGIGRGHRAVLVAPGPKATRLTRAFSGRLARGLENRFLLEMAERSDDVLPFPAQNALTRDLRRKAAELDRPEFLSLWAGTGVDRLRPMKTAELVRVLLAETLEAMRG